MDDLKPHELYELHEAYKRHEMVPWACVFRETSYAVVYVCPCGGRMGYSSVTAKKYDGETQMDGVARSKNIRLEWLEPLVKLAAKCPLIGSAWLRLEYDDSNFAANITASSEEVKEMEKKYGLTSEGLCLDGQSSTRRVSVSEPKQKRQRRSNGSCTTHTTSTRYTR